MTASLAVIPAGSYLPNKVEAELRLLTLSGTDNPLAAGGKLGRTLSGVSATWNVASGATAFSNVGVLSTTLPSLVTFVLEAPTGKRLLELSLEIEDYTSSWDPERVEVLVASKGVSAQIAQALSINAGSYSWRLSAKAAEKDATLRLTFDLVQEEVATEFVDALASTRLAFLAGSGGSVQHTVIRPKRFKESIEPTG